MRLGLVALLLIGCVEPGFMSTMPHWRADEQPLQICVDGYAEPPNLELASRVVRTINDRLGFKIYAITPTRADCVVIATFGVPAERGWMDPGGDARISTTLESGVRCEISTANTGTNELLFYTFEHELGHCLGLAHDDWNGSIMRRTQISTPDRQFGPWISDFDRQLIRDRYLRSR